MDIMNELNLILKRSALNKTLAEAELKNSVVWSDLDLQRASKECFVSNISRRDIDIEKEKLQNKRLQDIEKEKNKIFAYLEQNDVLDKSEQNKIHNGLIKLCNLEEKICKEIEKKYEIA